MSDLLEWLQRHRAAYAGLRDDAERQEKLWKGTPAGDVAAERRRLTEAALAQIDQAIAANESSQGK